MMGNYHVRFGAGEKIEITSKSYLLLLNIFPSKIYLMSTYKTHPQKISNLYFENYPEIIPNFPAKDEAFVDTTIINNAYLEALGGDYDKPFHCHSINLN